MEFEWDPLKDAINRSKHGVGFTEAKTAFLDPLGLFVPDDRELDEERWVLVAMSTSQRLLAVVHTDRDDVVRIISARLAVPREHAGYRWRQRR